MVGSLVAAIVGASFTPGETEEQTALTQVELAPTRPPVPTSTPTGPPTPTPIPTQTPIPTPTPTFVEYKNLVEAVSVSYSNLFRNIEEYLGDYVVFRGKVLQVGQTQPGEYLLLVYVTERDFGSWDDVIRVDYEGSRILEDDVIEFVGIVDEPWTYTTALGSSNTVPWVHAIRTRIVIPRQ